MTEIDMMRNIMWGGFEFAHKTVLARDAVTRVSDVTSRAIFRRALARYIHRHCRDTGEQYLMHARMLEHAWYMKRRCRYSLHHHPRTMKHFIAKFFAPWAAVFQRDAPSRSAAGEIMRCHILPTLTLRMKLLLYRFACIHAASVGWLRDELLASCPLVHDYIKSREYVARSNVMCHLANGTCGSGVGRVVAVALPLDVLQTIGQFASAHITPERPIDVRMPRLHRPVDLQTMLIEIAKQVHHHSLQDSRDTLQRLIYAIRVSASDGDKQTSSPNSHQPLQRSARNTSSPPP